MTKEQEEKIVKIVKNMSDEEIEDRIRQDEQEEAIEIIEKMVKSYIEADECGLSNNDFKHEIKAMQTVLSMLKEKDEYIKDANDITTEMSNDIKKLTSEIEKKDKIIDLMAEEINQLGGDYDDFCIDTVWNEDCDEDCKNCIKQYFERKSEE